jgi:DNA-binding response OmpR family regulator
VEQARLASGSEASDQRAVRPPRILLVEDDPTIRQMTQLALERDGFVVVTAHDSDSGLAAYRAQPPDLVLLDVMLPGVGGVGVCRTIREQSVVPIVMLTARSDPVDVVLGLEAGADDYVGKPVGLAELRSRIRAVLRRAGPRAQDVLTAGPLQLDRGARELRNAGAPVSLTFSEFEVIAALMSAPGRLLNRQELMRAIWGDSAFRDPRGIDVHVRHLREKLERSPDKPELILTVRGAGYRLAS